MLKLRILILKQKEKNKSIIIPYLTLKQKEDKKSSVIFTGFQLRAIFKYLSSLNSLF